MELRSLLNDDVTPRVDPAGGSARTLRAVRAAAVATALALAYPTWWMLRAPAAAVVLWLWIGLPGLLLGSVELAHRWASSARAAAVSRHVVATR